MTTTSGAYRQGTSPEHHVHKANPIGSILTMIGVAGFSVAVFLDWLGVEDGDAQNSGRSISGYDLTPLLPFIALFGIGLVVGLLYAQGRATRRQHRGLTLVTMAAGIAAAGMALAYLINPPGLAGSADNATTKLGIYVALISAALWALGSALFAKEAEGDDHHDLTTTHATQSDAYPNVGVPTTGAPVRDTQR